MYLRFVVAALLLSTGLLAHAAETPCPANRPVDDIIAEVHRQESKKTTRNKNPLPQTICILGWCRGARGTPPTLPDPPRAQTPVPDPDAKDDPSVSSSKSAADRCNEKMELALEAAHNVDVGDYSFEEKNYRGALSRYQEAADQKPGDPAIHVRLGRVFEKLNELPSAIENYQQAAKLEATGKWSDEARAALARLQPQVK